MNMNKDKLKALLTLLELPEDAFKCKVSFEYDLVDGELKNHVSVEGNGAALLAGTSCLIEQFVEDGLIEDREDLHHFIGNILTNPNINSILAERAGKN